MEGHVIIGGVPGRFARRAERLGAIVVAIALSLFPVGCQQPRVRVAGRASKRGVGGGRVPPAPHQWIRAPRGISWEGGGEEAKSMRARRTARLLFLHSRVGSGHFGLWLLWRCRVLGDSSGVWRGLKKGGSVNTSGIR